MPRIGKLRGCAAFAASGASVGRRGGRTPEKGYFRMEQAV